MIKAFTPGKKRFFIALNEKNMLFVQNWHKEKGIPKGNISIVFDEFLSGLCVMFKEFDKKTEAGEEVKASDIFAITGKIMKKMEETEK